MATTSQMLWIRNCQRVIPKNRLLLVGSLICACAFSSCGSQVEAMVELRLHFSLRESSGVPVEGAELALIDSRFSRRVQPEILRGGASILSKIL